MSSIAPSTARFAAEPQERLRGESARAEARRQLRLIARLRLVVVAAVLLPILLFDFVLRVESPSVDTVATHPEGSRSHAVVAVVSRVNLHTPPLYTVLGLAAVLGILSLLASRRIRSVPLNAAWQFGGDVVVETALLHVLGYEGAVALAIPLFSLTTFMACSLLDRRGVLFFASAAFGLQVAVETAAHAGWLPQETFQGALDPAAVRLDAVVFHLFVFMFIFYGTAWLVGSRAERYQRVTADLADLQVFHEHVVRSMSAGLVTTDHDGRILFCNAAAVRLLAEQLGALRGRTLHEVLGWQAHEAEDLRSLALPGASRRLLRDSSLGGRGAVSLDVRASQLADGSGESLGLLFLVEDVTEVRALEDELRLKDRMAAIGRMAAGIAHEIRNPLASISGSVHMLQGNLAPEGPDGRLMAIVLKESRRLDATIREFLEFARPRPARPRRMDLADVARETITLLSHSEELRPDHVIHAPDPSVHVPAEADPDQIRQVVWNLCKNALRAMPTGGVMDVTVTRRGPHAVLAVRDTGTGISPEMRARLFQPLSGEFKGGMGLGLAIVYRIVEDHGGRVHVDSAEGRGTTVEVALPVEVAAAAAEPGTRGTG